MLKKFIKKIYFKYFAKIKHFTVHLRGSLNSAEKAFFDSHPFRTDLKNINKILQNGRENILEIGFGDGHHLLTLAKENPNINFTGIELDQISIYKILKKIDKLGLKNLNIVCVDARIFIEKTSDNTFKKIFVPFPDPWPKKREQKRRLLNESFVKLLLDKFTTTGELIIATDINTYKDQIEKILSDIKQETKISFTKQDENELLKVDEIFNSKFAKKAKREGRTNTLFKITNLSIL